MKGQWDLFLLTVATWLSLADGRGIDLGLCSKENLVCACGTAGFMINIPVKRCTFFYQWRRYCRPCEKYDKDAVCSRFRHCLSCENRIDGACSACPVGRYGKHCQGVCQCQNGGVCDRNNGNCQCLRGYRGALCEISDYLDTSCSTPVFKGQITPNSAPYYPGTTVAFSCTSGYLLRGANSATCQTNGKWNPPIPQCVPEAKTCPALAAPANGQILNDSGDSQAGHRVQYKCSSGFQLSGPKERECLTGGTWSGADATCAKVIVCMDPGTPKNGDRETRDVRSRTTRRGPISRMRRPTSGQRSRMSSSADLPSGQFGVNTLFKFSCKKGYKLVGSASRTCQTSGQWSGEQARCTPVCGKSDGDRVTKIINGTVSRKGDYPWQVMLTYKWSDGKFHLGCGASLISENWVVTAAHCVTEEESINLLPKNDMKVYLGKYYSDINNDSEFVQEFTISEVLVNSNYDQQSLDSDIALIKLSGRAELTERVMPICLAENSLRGANLNQNLIKSGSFVTVTGWGQTENENVADRLLVTRLMTINNTECEHRYYKTGSPLTVTSNMFCAGDDDGLTDTCFGDSGGPAVAYIGGGEDRLWYLVGVVSWGGPDNCAVPMQSGGFTRISNFLDFIYTNTGL